MGGCGIRVSLPLHMNARVREMITEALRADGVEEIIRMGEGGDGEVNLFDDD